MKFMIRASALLCCLLGAAHAALAAEARGTVIDDPRWVVRLPPRMSSQALYPAVLAMGPDGDAHAAADLWSAVGEARGWIIIGWKECRNDLPFEEVVPKADALINEIAQRYPVDRARLIVSGYGGGAMAAHALAFSYPGRFAALVVNTGIIHPSFARQILAYPKAGVAVFLASPADFRYEEMQHDRRFLEQLQWRTEWIEFEGGHKPAPAAAYERAARWIDERLPRDVIPGDKEAANP